jgi:hypothetical protein
MLRSACSRWASLVTSNSRYAIPVSFLKRSAPLYAASLKDLSNFPPMSNTTAGENSWAVAGPARAMAARTRTATMDLRRYVMSSAPRCVDEASWLTIGVATGAPMIPIRPRLA